MSRRCHHGSPRHGRLELHDVERPMTNERSELGGGESAIRSARSGHRESVTAPADPIRAAASMRPPLAAGPDGSAATPALVPGRGFSPRPTQPPIVPSAGERAIRPVPPAAPIAPASAPTPAAPASVPAPAAPAVPAVHVGPSSGDPPSMERMATAPQLRRFIKSRAYVPIHELRRRFALNGEDDDVTPVEIDRTLVFVGLPDREGRLLGELFRAGDIGYELSMDPISPIVVGVYPMRPVTRN
jgi:hypothetical protein